MQLTQTSQNLLGELSDAAKRWGWVQDQGYGPEVASSESAYKDALARLEGRISYLEIKAKGYDKLLDLVED